MERNKSWEFFKFVTFTMYPIAFLLGFVISLVRSLFPFTMLLIVMCPCIYFAVWWKKSRDFLKGDIIK